MGNAHSFYWLGRVTLNIKSISITYFFSTRETVKEATHPTVPHRLQLNTTCNNTCPLTLHPTWITTYNCNHTPTSWPIVVPTWWPTLVKYPPLTSTISHRWTRTAARSIKCRSVQVNRSAVILRVRMAPIGGSLSYSLATISPRTRPLHVCMREWWFGIMSVGVWVAATSVSRNYVCVCM